MKARGSGFRFRVPGWLMGVRAIIFRTQSERELDDELQQYLNAAIEQKVASGMTRADATRAARADVGSVEAVKDHVRDVGWETRAETCVQDLRFAVRSFLRAPRFSIPALLALALGIGATSAIFSVVRGVMFEPLPYQEPDRIVVVWETTRGGGGRNGISAANLVAWRERNRSFDYLGMAGPARLAVAVNGQPEEIEGFTFSSDVFSALGVQPALGRAYTVDEDLDGNNALIVLSHEFWQTRLAGRRDVLGMALTTNGQRRTVVGVMPRGFTVAGERADALIPWGRTIDQLRSVPGRGNIYGIARLREHVSLEQAASEMRAIAAQLAEEKPLLNTGRSVMLVPVHEQMVELVRPALFALAGAVILVLLVACVNVANLLLARSATRERELGMRMALGARRGRLVRQLLTESLVLAAAGGLAGVAVAAMFHRGLLVLVGDRIPIPRLDRVVLDLPVVVFTMVTALMTGIIFGFVPAFVSTSHAGDALREGGRHGGGRRLRRVLGTLVVAEVALSLVLLAGAGVLMRSFFKLQSIDPGFHAEGVLTAHVQVPSSRYPDNTRTADFYREALSRITALPGVRNAAGVGFLPLSGPTISTGFYRLDKPQPAVGTWPSTRVLPITPGFFRTMGIRHITGRDFMPSDARDAPLVVIISESAARNQFPGENPLRKRLRVRVGDLHSVEVIGVVGDIKISSLEDRAGPVVYVPHPQLTLRAMTFVVRTEVDPMSLAGSVTKAVQALDAELPVSRLRTLDEVVSSTIARPRAVSMLVVVFALIALALAAVGVYGVMAYSVLERTQEIGIRVALGATTESVFRLVLGRAVRLIGVGIATGLIAAAVFTRLLERLLYEIEPFDPWTFGVTAIVLMVVATFASYLPARRGMQIAPIDALRTK